MSDKAHPFNIVIVAQPGRLSFAVFLRHCSPDFDGRLLIVEPQPASLWPDDPHIAHQGIFDALAALEAEIIPFENRHFGASFLIGNKIKMLGALPVNEPFVYFDSDTLITGDITKVPFVLSALPRPCGAKAPDPNLDSMGPGTRATGNRSMTCSISISTVHWI